VAGDFKVHNLLSDPHREYSACEVAISAPYIESAADFSFSLLNTPGVFTCFPFAADDRHAVPDPSFVTSALAPVFSSWSTRLPTTGSDHVPIMISLSAPLIRPSPPSLNWRKTYWASLTLALEQLTVPNPPPLSTKNSLSAWFYPHLSAVAFLLALHTPLKHHSIHSKWWWNDNLSALH